jgi:hypothetical protein
MVKFNKIIGFFINLLNVNDLYMRFFNVYHACLSWNSA